MVWARYCSHSRPTSLFYSPCFCRFRTWQGLSTLRHKGPVMTEQFCPCSYLWRQTKIIILKFQSFVSLLQIPGVAHERDMDKIASSYIIKWRIKIIVYFSGCSDAFPSFSALPPRTLLCPMAAASLRRPSPPTLSSPPPPTPTLCSTRAPRALIIRHTTTAPIRGIPSPPRLTPPS
jgi:hypothetical protein